VTGHLKKMHFVTFMVQMHLDLNTRQELVSLTQYISVFYNQKDYSNVTSMKLL